MGNLPQGWVECELGKLFEVVNGDRGKNYPAKSKLQATGIPFVSAVNIKNGELREDNLLCLTDEQYNLLNNGKINTEDTLLCIRGSIGKHCRFFKEKGAIASSMVIIRRNPFEILNRLLHYYLDSQIMKIEIKKYDNGSAQPNLSAADLKKIYFPLPPRNEQKQIVEKIEKEFGKIDEGIEKLKSAQEQITQYKQSVLKSAFEGKLYKDSEWEEKTLEEITCKITDGSHFSPKTVERSKYPYVTVKDVNNDAIDFENCKYISEDDYKELLKNGCQPELNDILFSKDGTVGKVTIINYVKKFVILSSLAIIRPNIDIIEPNYLKWALKNPEFLQEAINKKTGVAIRRIILRTLKTLKIKYPKNIEEQKQIVKEIEKRFEIADKAEKVIAENLNKAEQLKQSILKKAFDGRLVPQDPNDEPASILLEKIKAERGKNV